MASSAPHRPPSRDPSRTGIAAQLPAGPDPQDLKQLASAMAAAAVTLQRLPRAAGDGPAGARSALSQCAVSNPGTACLSRPITCVDPLVDCTALASVLSVADSQVEKASTPTTHQRS